MQKKKMLILS